MNNVNNALATLQYLGEGTITVSPTSSSILYYSGTGNYYEFISTNSSWTAAQSNANSKTYGSSTGYLATVTSSAEFTFIKNKAGLLNEIWLGGSDSGTEGVWRWMGGPENGQQFWQGRGPAQPQQEVLLVVCIQVGMALVNQMTQAMRIALQS